MMKRSLLVGACLVAIAFSLFSTLRSCRRANVPGNDRVLVGLGTGLAMVANVFAKPGDEVVVISWKFENNSFRRYFQAQEKACLDTLRNGPAGRVTLESLRPFQPDALQGFVLEDQALESLLKRYPGTAVVVSFIGPPDEHSGYLAGRDPKARPRIICLVESAGQGNRLLDRGLISAAVVPCQRAVKTSQEWALENQPH
jgi:hypothetical protein